jgi:[glutamine synthetase] adenylyltransferase / [glutamine synthetase]-adenylyl-L-tyrosine phosphorylase
LARFNFFLEQDGHSAMDVDTIKLYLDDPKAAGPWLKSQGIVDKKAGHTNLVEIANQGVTLDLLAIVCELLEKFLPDCPDSDMALRNLNRYWAVSRNPLSMGTLFQRDPETLRVLLQIFSNSQHLSDQLVNDPESLDLIRLSQGMPISREELVGELTAEVDLLKNNALVLGAIRRFKYRETLRIAFGDIIREQSLQTVTRQISFVADAIMEAALLWAWRATETKWGTPRTSDGRRCAVVVLAMGKLGGVELNYSSDIDLIVLFEEDGQTDSPRPIPNTDFFTYLVRDFAKLMTEVTDMGMAYRVDLRLRPEGSRGPLAMSVPNALRYYDSRGRTWERQAMIKARPAAGDLALGQRFLKNLESWIYRRYLSAADISGIKLLKRRIEKRAHKDGIDKRDVKLGLGGIRDIEFVIQFLQLLNGANSPKLHTANTLEAIAQLEQSGCLTHQERMFLEENYAFLRKVEHRLQIMFDLQTHLLPEGSQEMHKLAFRLGFVDTPKQSALEAFESEYNNRTELNRKILDHLLHDAFTDDGENRPESDLVLDPNPSEEQIAQVLGQYGFQDVQRTYRNLCALGEENIRFLSTRRCRHFLASIAPKLLEQIALTPDPDSTLINLDKATTSIGGKGILWELFSFNLPSLQLFVELCAYSPYLYGILTSNPGMIDELMDSLVLDRLPGRKQLGNLLSHLCGATENPERILHSFKNDQILRVGVRDILGKEDILVTTKTLSAIAETCLSEIATREYDRLTEKYGVPMIDPSKGGSSKQSRPCELIILGMGKLGGREMNYHSDLDVVFIYEADGFTQPANSNNISGETTNQHFFFELGQRIIKSASRLTEQGRLYEIDARLRPTGKSGPLAIPLAELERYFLKGDGQLWERQALCKARVVFGSERAAKSAMRTVHRSALNHPWKKADASAIREMRARQVEKATDDDIKRGPGGMVDIEFTVQMLQLKYGRRNANIRSANTLDALHRLHEANLLPDEDYYFFSAGYRALRTVESRLHLISTSGQSRLPEDPTERQRLTHLLGYSGPDCLIDDCLQYQKEIRERFDQIFDKMS